MDMDDVGLEVGFSEKMSGGWIRCPPRLFHHALGSMVTLNDVAKSFSSSFHKTVMKHLCQMSEQYISLKLHYIFKSESAPKYLGILRSVKNTDSHQ